MPGALGFGWHEGSRSEYLAQYFLTAMGVSAPVLRQEDIGVDFYCAVGKEEDKKLTFHSPYSVQVGAVGEKFIYGDLDDKGRWHKASLDWLFAQELPLFVGTVDQASVRFRLYTTSSMWPLRYQFGEMTAVELCPETWHDPLKESKSAVPICAAGNGDGYSYRVPLFNPIVDLTVADLQSTKRFDAIDALTEAIDVEQNNITNRRLGIHAATWFPGNESNNASWLRRHKGGGTFWSSQPGRNIAEQAETLKEIAVVLALNLQAQGEADKIKNLAPAFRLCAPDSIPRWLAEKLPPEIQEVLREKPNK